MFKSEQVGPDIDNFLNILDIVTVFILFSDYVFRWITYDIKSGYGKKAFLLYPFTPMAIIDLLSILPSVTILHDGFKFLRILRIVRILRMFNGLTIMTNVFIRERKALMSIFFFMCVYVLSVGLIMFTFEPDTFATFLDALYWSTTALATIGYGDITPVTDFGKFIAIVSSMVGIAIVAFPAGIVTGGYITQLQKARSKGREYFALPVRHDKIFKGKQITKYKSIKAYFKANKKVKYYSIWILICLAISIVTTIYAEYDANAILYFDEYGSILVSVILEPTAGIVVSLINETCFSIYAGSPYAILTFFCGAMYSLIFGVYFRRGRKITAKSIFMVFLVLVVLNSLYLVFMIFLVSPDASIQEIVLNYEHLNWARDFLPIDETAAVIIYYFIARFVYAAFSLISVLLVRNFLWGSKIDPMLKIPVRKRYRQKIYKRGKNEHSYIQTWLESNSDEDEDIPEFEAVVKQGRKSIEFSKKTIEKKREEMAELQKDVQEKIADIQQYREEIARHEQAIDIKRRAVKRVKRSKRVHESDILPNFVAPITPQEHRFDENAPGADTVGQTGSFEPLESNTDKSNQSPKHAGSNSDK